MADDLTLGEVARSVTRIEVRLDRALKDIDDRHAALASKVVPTDLWRAEHESLENEVRQLRDDVRQAVERIERTSLERRAALVSADQELGKQIEALRRDHDLRLKELATGEGERETRGTARVANIIAAVAALAAVALLLVTILGRGGH